MSQTSKTLKKIASSEEYKSLATAVEQSDYETVFTAYNQVAALLEEARREVRQKIDALPRENRDEDYHRFQQAFISRCKTELSQWHRIDSELKRQKVMEGEIFGLGSRGDPMAKTSGGRVVIIRGADLKEGDKVTFRIVAEGGKVDFAHPLELNPSSLYRLLNQDTWDNIGERLNSVRESLKGGLRGEDKLEELSQALNQLEEVKPLAADLKDEDKEKTLSKVSFYRKRLLATCMESLALEFISRREEEDIRQLCQSDAQAEERALKAPGLFRCQAHRDLKARLQSKSDPQDYGAALDEMQANLDSMGAALEMLDFKDKIERLRPTAYKYLEKMDGLFRGLSQEATRLAVRLGEGDICQADDIRTEVEKAFSTEALCAHMRQAFRKAEEFRYLRGALDDLINQTGDGSVKNEEAALKPYLDRITEAAFPPSR